MDSHRAITHLSLAEAADAAGSKNAVTAYIRDVLASQGVVGPLATRLEAAWAANASKRMVQASGGALTLRMAKLIIDHKPASVQVDFCKSQQNNETHKGTSMHPLLINIYSSAGGSRDCSNGRD